MWALTPLRQSAPVSRVRASSAWSPEDHCPQDDPICASDRPSPCPWASRVSQATGSRWWVDASPGLSSHEAPASCFAEERILRFLETKGPQRALHIAKALGMTTAKEVNPILYSMRNKHLLTVSDTQMWTIYRSSQEGQERGMRGQSRFGEVGGQGSGWEGQVSGQEGQGSGLGH